MSYGKTLASPLDPRAGPVPRLPPRRREPGPRAGACLKDADRRTQKQLQDIFQLLGKVSFFDQFPTAAVWDLTRVAQLYVTKAWTGATAPRVKITKSCVKIFN